MIFKHGVHTIEINGDKDHHISIAKTHGEYLPIREAEEAIEAERRKRGDTATVTRIDYRFDSQDESYQELLPRMRQLVYTFAYCYGMFERVQPWSDYIGIPHSVRAMPEDGNRGIEFYDKPYQKQTEKYGKGRLELRWWKLSGERLSWIMNQWKESLSRITKSDYRNMLEGHAKELLSQYHRDGEKIGILIRRIYPFMIGREEERMLYLLAGKRPQQRKECDTLPVWEDLRAMIEDIGTMLVK